MKQHLAKDGVLLLSGLLTNDQAELRSKSEARCLYVSEIKERNDWICVRVTKDG